MRDDGSYEIGREPIVPRASRQPHKVMTPDEYRCMVIVGWHEVCRNVDGCGGVGVRFLGTDQ
jgi:hypothetical protein